MSGALSPRALSMAELLAETEATMKRGAALTAEVQRRMSERRHAGKRGVRGPNTAWTPERDAELVACRRAGMSASEVGVEMGVTRNAVLGRMNRLRSLGAL